MITLFRAVSQFEKDNYDSYHLFQTGKNTLEAKQFFKSRTAINQFVARSVLQNYDPPYLYLLMVDLEQDCFDMVIHKNMDLDGFEAITIDEDYLSDFNNCVSFVVQEPL